MSEYEATILLVEDAPDMLEVATVFLEKGGYKVIQKTDGQQAWNLLQAPDEEIHAVLSDVLMPVMDGYQLCENIRNDKELKDLPVIFMSSLTDLDEKIKGYEVGADEYVTKPVAFEELNEKLKRMLDVRKGATQLKKQITTSNSAALEAMNYSSDLGQILNFYKTSLSANSYADLARDIFDITGFLDLKASIIFVTDDGTIFHSDTGMHSPLEVNILELARKKARFYDFDARTIVNYQSFSLLIKNMPVERPERYGVLKDTLGAFGDAIEARVKALIASSLESKRVDILNTIDTAMRGTGDTLNSVHEDSTSAMDNLMADIEEAFISLGLTEQQEQGIRDIVNLCRQRTDKAFSKSSTLLEDFNTIRKQLQESLSINTKF